ncbi:hypothetical protein EDB19DRAFT_1745480, partial [Suillus lakei]
EPRAHPKRSENVPAWAEAVVPLGEVMDVPDSDGNMPTDEDADDDFLRSGVRVVTPHWGMFAFLSTFPDICPL